VLAELKIPHMGWNRLRIERASPFLAGIPDGAMVYFVHSYYCRPADASVILATTEHGIPFCSVLGRDHIMATQFHPEKSGDVGLRMLDNFARL
jgi:glutamine amidotransferase